MEPWILTVAGGTAFFLGVYLFAALLRPEWFS